MTGTLSRCPGRAARGPLARARLGVGAAAASPAVLLAGCGGPHSAFADPASEAASAIAWLWWVLLAVTLVIFLAVLAGWGYALFRRRPDGAEPEPEGHAVRWVVVAGALVPAVILLGLAVATIRTGALLADRTGKADALVVEVTGHQFWWEARYPESGAVTANEIHVPTDRPTRLVLRTNDVIHSLWVPRLNGKLDLTPGRTGELTIHPEEPGVYRGFCAEFCGAQHALMGLRIVAESPEGFEHWLAHHAAAASAPIGTEPDEQAGARLFVALECNLCHRVRGAPFPQPVEDVGPDLTHVASRATLAAATLENTPEMLARWIRDPHRLKPGVRMPATPLRDEQLRQLVAYLEGLR